MNNKARKLFGNCWELFGNLEKSEAEARVGVIDEKEGYTIGLSAMQLRNLDIERRSEPLNTQILIKSIRALDKGLLGSQNYRKLFVQSGEIKKTAQIYNASGMRAIGGCGIRISSILAEDLELKIGDIISLRKK